MSKLTHYVVSLTMTGHGTQIESEKEINEKQNVKLLKPIPG
jgi:hypothetical protein